MALETGTYIDDLITSNPVGASDNVSQGDDHIRLIKSCLKNTFPNATKAFYFETAQAKSANYTVVAADDRSLIAVSASGAARTITLPAAASSSGFTLWVVKSDSSTNTVTIDGNASETINGATTLVLSAQYDIVKLWCNGTGWYASAVSSVLDADTFDGLDSVQFMRSPTTIATSRLHDLYSDWDDAIAIGMYLVVNWATNIPTNGPSDTIGNAGGYGILAVYRSNPSGSGADYVHQVYLSARTPTEDWARHSADGGTTWTNWARVWNSRNMGAGSGLDADLLDGAQGAAYALLAGASFTGLVTLGDEVRSSIKALTSSASISVVLTDQNVQEVTLDHNATFTVSGAAAGQWCTLVIKQGSTGGTGAFSGVSKWNGGSAPTLSTTAGEYDVVSFQVVTGGVVLGTYLGRFS